MNRSLSERAVSVPLSAPEADSVTVIGRSEVPMAPWPDSSIRSLDANVTPLVVTSVIESLALMRTSAPPIAAATPERGRNGVGA